MLQSLRAIQRCRVVASDGELGTVVDVMLDHQSWMVRRVRVRVGGRLAPRVIEIAPMMCSALERAQGQLSVRASRQELLAGAESPHGAEVLVGCTVHGTDGVLGRVHDALVDDQNWMVKAVVLEPRDPRLGMTCAISPQRLGLLNASKRTLAAHIARAHLEHEAARHVPQLTEELDERPDFERFVRARTSFPAGAPSATR